MDTYRDKESCRVFVRFRARIQITREGKEWYGYLLSQWKKYCVAGIIESVIGLTYAILPNQFIRRLYLCFRGRKSGGGLGSALGLASSLV
jgi:hypothetical protein